MRLFHHPILCNYYLTYRCNAACSFCDIWEKPSPYATPEHVAANLRDLKRLGVRVVDFTGGEPLLHRQLPEFLSLARDEGLITTVTTNGLLYPKQAQALKGKVDMLHFSLDAADALTHDTGRGVACFDFVMRSLDIAAELGERPDVLFTVTDENLPHLERIYREITRPRDLLLILNPIFEYNTVGSQLQAASFQALRHWGRQPGIYLNDAFLTLREQGGNHTDHPVCRAASSTVVISPENALVLPCYHLGEQHYPIENRLYDLWQSPLVARERAQEGRSPQCEGCTINCYMQPSFAFELNSWFLRALPSTLKYTVEKWVY
ncbi:MAG: radical SAM protein [Bacteroidetes bacterium]|nr:radical SAM protein [Bacteroidota bacterium]